MAEKSNVLKFEIKKKIGETKEEGKKKEISARLKIKKMEESREETSKSIRKEIILKGEEALKSAVETFKGIGFSLQEVMESVKNMAFMEDLKKEGKSDDEIQKLTVEIFDSIR